MTRLEAAIVELVDALRAEVAATAPVAVEAPPERLLTIEETRERLGGIARSTVYSEIRAGRLRSIKLAKRRMLASSSVDAYIASRGDTALAAGGASPR